MDGILLPSYHVSLMDIHRFDISHSPDTVRFVPGVNKLNRDAVARIRSAVSDHKGEFQLNVAVRQLDAATAEIRFTLAAILEPTQREPYALGETVVPLNEDVRLDEIVQCAVAAITRFEEEDLERR